MRPPPIPQSELPEIKYYTRAAFRKAERDGLVTKIEGSDGIHGNKRHLYLEKRDGSLVQGAELSAMRDIALAIFLRLASAEKAPLQWGDAPLDVREMVYGELEKRYEVFRFCEHGWKVKNFVKLQYPGFKQKHMSKNIKKEEPQLGLPRTHQKRERLESPTAEHTAKKAR